MMIITVHGAAAILNFEISDSPPAEHPDQITYQKNYKFAKAIPPPPPPRILNFYI